MLNIQARLKTIDSNSASFAMGRKVRLLFLVTILAFVTVQMITISTVSYAKSERDKSEKGDKGKGDKSEKGGKGKTGEKGFGKWQKGKGGGCWPVELLCPGSDGEPEPVGDCVPCGTGTFEACNEATVRKIIQTQNEHPACRILAIHPQADTGFPSGCLDICSTPQ